MNPESCTRAISDARRRVDVGLQRRQVAQKSPSLLLARSVERGERNVDVSYTAIELHRVGTR